MALNENVLQRHTTGRNRVHAQIPEAICFTGAYLRMTRYFQTCGFPSFEGIAVVP
ncbi:hypothetical protein [Parasegetibacter sp. NRK P23]|uniref:hypothetical protein n=1 Tax=Parasegetibacter sp. NRK P23 TaxID=2942999 RepID=UPI00204417B3|nr:hypothetical protein [Parasegetibacter sp. NRK P23]MCM5528090.1 hypothetical protein [Parasegetibacter sp. NRK P23]